MIFTQISRELKLYNTTDHIDIMVLLSVFKLCPKRLIYHCNYCWHSVHRYSFSRFGSLHYVGFKQGKSHCWTWIWASKEWMYIMEVRSEVLQRQNNATELNTMLRMYFRGNLAIYCISESKGSIKNIWLAQDLKVGCFRKC